MEAPLPVCWILAKAQQRLHYRGSKTWWLRHAALQSVLALETTFAAYEVCDCGASFSIFLNLNYFIFFFNQRVIVSFSEF